MSPSCATLHRSANQPIRITDAARVPGYHATQQLYASLRSNVEQVVRAADGAVLSTIRDQTEAAFQCWALDSQNDLGRPGDPSFNTLSVTSGHAIDDRRQFESAFDRYIYATGTTLNGMSFAGQTIEGPAELAPHYRIVSGDSGLQL